MTDALLEVKGIEHRFNGVRALVNVTLDVYVGEMVGVIGPNGAGKSTLFGVISGFLRPLKGQVLYQGRNLVGLAPHKTAKRGLARTFQATRPLPDLSVIENVMAGTFSNYSSGLLGTLLGLPHARRQELASFDQSWELLQKFDLAALADALPSQLTSGQLRLLEIARVLATEPTIVLLDEPAAGLTSSEVQALESTLSSLKREGITCVLVEHDIDLVFRVCDRVVVLNFGEVLAQGTSKDIQSHPAVIEAYLGATEDSSSSLDTKTERQDNG